jgi:hypothetical protein
MKRLGFKSPDAAQLRLATNPQETPAAALLRQAATLVRLRTLAAKTPKLVDKAASDVATAAKVVKAKLAMPPPNQVAARAAGKDAAAAAKVPPNQLTLPKAADAASGPDVVAVTAEQAQKALLVAALVKTQPPAAESVAIKAWVAECKTALPLETAKAAHAASWFGSTTHKTRPSPRYRSASASPTSQQPPFSTAT